MKNRIKSFKEIENTKRNKRIKLINMCLDQRVSSDKKVLDILIFLKNLKEKQKNVESHYLALLLIA